MNGAVEGLIRVFAFEPAEDTRSDIAYDDHGASGGRQQSTTIGVYQTPAVTESMMKTTNRSGEIPEHSLFGNMIDRTRGMTESVRTPTMSSTQLSYPQLSARSSSGTLDKRRRLSGFTGRKPTWPVKSLSQLKLPRSRSQLSTTLELWVLEARGCTRVRNSYISAYRSIPPAPMSTSEANSKPTSAFDFEIIWDVDDVWIDKNHASSSISFKFKSHFFNQFKVIGSQNLQLFGVHSHEDREQLLAGLVELAGNTPMEEHSPLVFPSSYGTEFPRNNAASVVAEPSYTRSTLEGSERSVADTGLNGRPAILKCE